MHRQALVTERKQTVRNPIFICFQRMSPRCPARILIILKLTRDCNQIAVSV